MQRSGACQITIKVLEHDESEPVPSYAKEFDVWKTKE